MIIKIGVKSLYYMLYIQYRIVLYFELNKIWIWEITWSFNSITPRILAEFFAIDLSTLASEREFIAWFSVLSECLCYEDNAQSMVPTLM